MLLGKVIGNVVASQKEPSIEGLKLLILRRIDPHDNSLISGTVVAADAVGAGVGEVVLYASGSSARQTQVTDGRPIDAVVMAIVDTYEVGGETRYVKE